MENKKVLGIFAFAIFSVLSLSLVVAFGQGNRMSEERTEIRNSIQEERAEFREALAEARANKDFALMEELKSQFDFGKRMNKRNINLSPCN